MRVPIIVACAAAAAVASPLYAATYHIAPDGSGDFPTIQAAIDAASSGDEIVLSDGTFTGEGNWDLNFGTKELVLRSENGYESTVLYGGFECISLEPTHRAVLLDGGQTAATRIEGVTIHRFVGEGGTIRCVGTSPTIRSVRFNWNHGVQEDSHGLSIVVHNGAPTIEDCVFEPNGCDHGREDGMAVYARGARVTIQRCLFFEMESRSGGLINIDGGTIEDCRFEHTNQGDNVDGHQGYCVNVVAGQVVIHNSRFLDTFGGAVWVHSPAHVLIGSCVFEYNTGDVGPCVFGGGTITIRNTTFRENLGGRGTSVVSLGGSITLDHCVFLNNNASWDNSGEVALGGDVLVTHCTFAGNTGHQDGAAIRLATGSHASIDHTIIAFGEGSYGVPSHHPLRCDGAPASLVVTCSDFHGNEGGDWTGCVAGMETMNGNLSADPLFCDVAAGDLTLHADSPCAPASTGECGLIGALGPWCGPLAVEPSTWGSIKALYR